MTVVEFLFATVLLIVIFWARSYLARRIQQVTQLRAQLYKITAMRIKEDIQHQRPWRWRFELLSKSSTLRMIFSFKPIKTENFYKDTTFLKPGTGEEPTVMYALFAYIGGVWGFAGVDPHETCAAFFIDNIDEAFGEGTAFVAKLPDKSDHSSTNDVQAHADLAGLLTTLENGELDLNAEFAKFTKHHEDDNN